MALDPVVVGQPHTDAHNAERAEINILDAAVATLQTSALDIPANRQRIRQDVDFRTRQPLNTEATVVTTTVPDATLGKSYSISIAGIAASTGRKATTADLANYPVDVGQPASYLDLYNANSVGYLWNCGINDNTVAAPAQNTYRLMPNEFRLRTNAPKIAFTMYRLQGAIVDGHQIFINGQPVTLRPQVGTAIGDYLVITFPDSATREITLCTTAGLGPIYVSPNYEVWKPEPRMGPIFYISGDSYSDPIVWADGGVASGILLEGLGFGIGFGLGASDHYVDAIGGTGFIKVNSAAESSGGTVPNNYEARLPQVVRAAATAWANNQQDFVWFLPNGAVNDVANYGTVVGSVTISQQEVINAFRRMANAIRAAHPNAKIIWGQGFTPPLASMVNLGPSHTALRQALQAQCSDLGVYYIDTTGWLAGTGYLSAGVSATVGTTSGSAVITGTGFTAGTVGATIVGAGIPAGATIVSYQSATQVTMSANATATASGVAVTLGTTRTDGNSSLYVGNDATHLNGLGYRYIKGRYAPKLKRIMVDTGALLNQVI